MAFANPWGLLGLLALPAILGIHLFHQRFPPMMVAGVHLWATDAQVPTAGRRRDRLPITMSLLLELLAALLLALLLSEPRFGELDQVSHLVVVLDNSASMMATPPGKASRSFRDSSIREVETRIGQVQRRSVVTLILTGRRPVMLAGPAVPWQEARSRLLDWKPAAPQHDFQPAWDLAAQLCEESGQLLFLTDHIPASDVTVPKQMEIVSVGRSLDNVAITTARWTFNSNSNRGHIFLRVSNRSRRAADVVIRGRAKDRDVFRQSLSIPADAEVPLETDVHGGLGQLEIHITSPNDGLAIDNSVTLIEPKVRMLTVANTLPQEETSRRVTDRVLGTIPDLQFGAAASAQLIVSPANSIPPSRRNLWWLGIGPIDSSAAAKKQAKDLLGPFLLEKRHPLLEGIVLGGVVWGGVQPMGLDVTPLISSGNDPLLARLNGTQTTAYLMNIDFRRSNLSESPDWPILLSNLVQLRRATLPGLRRWNYRLNEDILFRLFEGRRDPLANPTDLVLRHNGEAKQLARTAVVELPPLSETGIYEIIAEERVIGRFAVNFLDVEESTLTKLGPGLRPPESPVLASTFAIDNPYSWVIALGIAAVILVAFLDWYALKPRAIK